MSYLSFRGLIIRSVRYKENDRILSILTMDKGIVQACAPGAGKTSGRFVYSTQPLMLCDFVLSKTRDYYYLRESETIEAFQAVSENIEKLTASAHMLEIVSDVCMDFETCRAVYPLIIHALYALSKNEKEDQQIVSVFEWKILGLLGFSANLGLCNCGETDPLQYGAFSYTHCRIFCRKSACLSRAAVYQLISPGCLDALVYSYNAPIEKIFSFSVSSKILSEMTGITRKYLCERLEKNYKRMDLLSDIPEWPVPAVQQTQEQSSTDTN